VFSIYKFINYVVFVASAATPARPLVPPVESTESDRTRSTPHPDADLASNQYQGGAAVNDDFQMHETEPDPPQSVEDGSGEDELVDDEPQGDYEADSSEQSHLDLRDLLQHDRDHDILMGDLSDLSESSDDDSVPVTNSQKAGTSPENPKAETPASETKRGGAKVAVKGIGSTAEWPIDEVELERMKASSFSDPDGLEAQFLIRHHFLHRI
jgi:hypothetical protein